TIEECESALAASRIDADLLAAIDSADTDLAVTRAQHEAAAARVQVTALGDLDLTVDGAERHLAAEEELSAAVTESVQLELPGTLGVSVSPARSSADTESALSAAQQRLDELLRQAGVGDRRAAHRLAESEQRTRAELDRARERLAEELDGQTVSQLQADQARLAARVELTEHTTSTGSADEDADTDPASAPAAQQEVPAPVDPASAQEAQAAAARAHTEARARTVEAVAVRGSLAERASRLELDCTLLEGKASMAETDINDQRTALAEEREKTPDADLEHAADQATADLTEAKSALAAAESELAAAPVEQV